MSEVTVSTPSQKSHQALLFVALSKNHACIEFDLQGNVLYANSSFLNLFGYVEQDVVGKHHRMFCSPGSVGTEQYQLFWDALRKGHSQEGEFLRINAQGEDVYIQASYTPVHNDLGELISVIKIATDITATKSSRLDAEGKLGAIDRSQAVIEFDIQGTVLFANSNFLELMNYTLDEIKGRHHRLFVEPAFANTQEYHAFWERLGRGQYASGEFKRLGKGGQEVWIQATYNPIYDPRGRLLKVVKFATDITDSKLSNSEFKSKVDAISLGQAVIEFDLNGHVISANRNFLNAMGYTAREIEGQHHSIFCTQAYTQSEEYRDFWLKLNEGKFISGRFHRVGKYSRDVWIQATYNPILDLNGKVTKVVKFAYDVTKEVMLEKSIHSKSQEMRHSVSQLVDSIGKISGHSSSAAELADKGLDAANTGSRELKRSIAAINAIQNSSNKVSEIVRVIGDIANQTNLLAFNAAIEAARAGQHGVGFSVVAAEVRKLAESSSGAAREIALLIEESAAQVGEGVEVSQNAAKSFEGILSSVSETSESMKHITSAAQEQRDLAYTVTCLIEDLTTNAQASKAL